LTALRPIIWLSTQEWDDVWTRKQRFARMFAARGHRVLYVESPTHLLTFARRIPSSVARAMACLGPPAEVEPNLFVYTPPVVLPYFQRFDFVNNLNAALLAPCVKRAVKHLGLVDPLLWVYPPYAAPLVERLGCGFVIYDCVDEWSSFTGLLKRETVARQEARLLKNADVVFVTSSALEESKRPLAARLRLVPNAAEFEHFSKAVNEELETPDELRDLPRPILGFIGGVQYWLDLELLEHVAVCRPEWSLVLVGPVGRLAKVDGLRSLQNCHLLGLRPYEQLPAYLKAFDVCLNPFKVDETSRSVSPLKLFEYMAAGKRVVSTDMPEVRAFEGLVSIARDRNEFVDLIECELADIANAKRTEQIISEAQKHTWEKRFETIVDELGEVLKC
jgi:glycosyltransferase involved in cell wall biosynthesis